jgi:hypothetical protein
MTTPDLSNEGLARLAEDLKKITPPRYCEAHKPCDAKEHQLGYVLASGIFGIVIGSLVYGLIIMFGVNMVLADWLDVVPSMDYDTAIMGTAALYVLRLIAKL